ncbi:CD320 antigen-like [Amphiura filiformis]|uniref:CD320 antigen-like n=1 Tax=Amphiura filiformis TaxID=82378 RepID=UPI003B213F63
MDLRFVLLGLTLMVMLYAGQCSQIAEKNILKKRSYQGMQSLHRALQKRDDRCRDDEREWKCKTGKCVDASYICDGEEDCNDNSDERGCGAYTCNPNMQFQCPKGMPKCLMLTDVCNGIEDCKPGGEDEVDCEEDFECDGGTSL